MWLSLCSAPQTLSGLLQPLQTPWVQGLINVVECSCLTPSYKADGAARPRFLIMFDPHRNPGLDPPPARLRAVLGTRVLAQHRCVGALHNESPTALSFREPRARASAKHRTTARKYAASSYEVIVRK